MMKNNHKFALTALCAACVLGLSQSASAYTNVTDRSAKGDLAAYGGATRLKGDVTEYYKDVLKLALQKRAKNVILFICDGTSDQEYTAARNYLYGAGGYFPAIDTMPIVGAYTNYALDKKTRLPYYATDSDASATEWATGVKTYNGAIGVDLDEKPHDSLLVLAKKKGLATGDITNTEIQDATPASMVAHVTWRKCYGPVVTAEKCPTNLQENGGLGSITEQLLNTRPDVAMGGGMKTFGETVTFGKYAGKTLLEQAKDMGYNVVTTASELEKVTEADQKKTLLGLFAEGNMPYVLTGPQATLHGNTDKPAVKCEANPDHTPETPMLADMTKKAIDLLKTNPKGFFLQVEGGIADKAAHKAIPCSQFGEIGEFDKALKVAMDFAKESGDTLVIATGDHGHATQIIYRDTPAPGFTEKLITADGAPMDVSYATSENVNVIDHSGTQVRTAAYGPASINFMGLIDQSDMFFIIKNALDL